MTQELVLSGADIVKVGIGPGSVCTTRIQTGVGYPQLSAVIECADAAHGLGAHIIADGGCTCPGDVAKGFGGGADFVMLGGMLAGHDEGGRKRVEQRNAVAQHIGETVQHRLRRQFDHVFGVLGFRQAEGDPEEIAERCEPEENEDQMPVPEQHDRLADRRRDHRNDHEYHHDQRHDLGHLAAAVKVAHDRDGDDAGCGRAEPLTEAHDKHHGEARYEGTENRADEIDHQADKQRQLAPEPVRQRAIGKLRHAEAQHIGRDDELMLVFGLDAEAGADLLEARQHDVDGQRVERHQPRHHRDQFPFAGRLAHQRSRTL